MNRVLYLVTVLLVVLPAASWAQKPILGEPETKPRELKAVSPFTSSGTVQADLMEATFFPPEIVMQHQKAIGLTADQQTAIRADMQKTMASFTDLQWRQSAELEAMTALLKQDRPDETQVLAQLDKLLNVENDIKRLHAGLLVRIKNLLTPEQEARIRELKGTGPRPRTMGSRPAGQQSR
jgi:Spy/CpxP family protein refolding chaperone